MNRPRREVETGRAAALEKEIRELQDAEPEPATNRAQRRKVAISAQIALRAAAGSGLRHACGWDVVPYYPT